MPIKIPDGLPARDILSKERIAVMKESTAIRQDIRPLRFLLLNLMPEKIPTETQIARVIGASPLQIELTLLRTDSYMGTNTSEDHLLGFYKTLTEIQDEYFDGIIITGAPLAHIAFEDVAYWPEFKEIQDWSIEHCYSRFFICWGALAGLHHFYGLDKHCADTKQFGIFAHKRLDFTHPLTRGFDDIVNIPVSRYARIADKDFASINALKPLLSADESGLSLLVDDIARNVFMLNHLEYDRETLHSEYKRDSAKNINTKLPSNYYPDNDPACSPVMTWRAHRNLLFANWINMVYQGTPYDLQDLKSPDKIVAWP